MSPTRTCRGRLLVEIAAIATRRKRRDLNSGEATSAGGTPRFVSTVRPPVPAETGEQACKQTSKNSCRSRPPPAPESAALICPLSSPPRPARRGNREAKIQEPERAYGCLLNRAVALHLHSIFLLGSFAKMQRHHHPVPHRSTGVVLVEQRKDGIRHNAIEAKPTPKTTTTMYRLSLPPSPSTRRPAATPERVEERGGNGRRRSTLNESFLDRPGEERGKSYPAAPLSPNPLAPLLFQSRRHAPAPPPPPLRRRTPIPARPLSPNPVACWCREGALEREPGRWEGRWRRWQETGALVPRGGAGEGAGTVGGGSRSFASKLHRGKRRPLRRKEKEQDATLLAGRGGGSGGGGWWTRKQRVAAALSAGRHEEVLGCRREVGDEEWACVSHGGSALTAGSPLCIEHRPHQHMPSSFAGRRRHGGGGGARDFHQHAPYQILQQPTSSTSACISLLQLGSLFLIRIATLWIHCSTPGRRRVLCLDRHILRPVGLPACWLHIPLKQLALDKDLICMIFLPHPHGCGCHEVSLSTTVLHRLKFGSGDGLETDHGSWCQFRFQNCCLPSCGSYVLHEEIFGRFSARLLAVKGCMLHSARFKKMLTGQTRGGSIPFLRGQDPI